MRLAFCLAALLASTAARAQTPDSLGAALAGAPGPVVTIEEAVRIALDRSPDLDRAGIADRTSVLAVQSARANRLPSLSLQVGPTQQVGLAFDQTTGQLTSQSVQTLNVGAVASLNVYDGRRTRYLVEGARLDREARP